MKETSEEEEKLIQELLRCWSDGSIECRVGPFPHGIIPFIKIADGTGFPTDNSRDKISANHEVEVSGDGGMEDIDA